jgi:two-component system LytT family response regulator
VKALIIEDESLAVDALLSLIRKQAPFIEVVGIGRDGKQGLDLILEHNPDLIFLDISMPLLNGFEMLSQLRTLPGIVFTTAYDEYAIKAFEINSIDYLLKPIEPQRFQKTIQRLTGSHQAYTPKQEQLLLDTLRELVKKKDFTSITIKTGDRILFIPLEDITHFYADEKYVLLNTLDSKTHITTFTLQELDEKLPPDFIRVSRSAIINRHHIREARKLFGKKFTIILKDARASEVETGSSYVDRFLKLIE